MPSIGQYSSNAGELSPFLHARQDLEKFRSGFRVLENFILLPQGGFYNRPGTNIVGRTKADAPGRLQPFRFSLTTRFMLVFTAGIMRIYKDRAPIMDGGSPYEVVTPYPEAVLFQFQFRQINDIAFITHPDYPPHKLSRLADDDWTLEPVPFDSPPFLPENIETDHTITPSALTGSIQLTASEDTFTADSVGGYYQLGHSRRANSVELKGTSFVLWDGSDGVVAGTIDLEWWSAWSPTDAFPTNPATASVIDAEVAARGAATGSVTIASFDFPQTPAAATNTMRRATMNFTAPTTEDYTFYLSADDGASLYIGGVFHKHVFKASGEVSIVVPLAAGAHVIEVYTWHNAAPYNCRLSYKTPRLPKQILATLGAAGAGLSSRLRINERWNLRTYGYWSARIALEASYDQGDTWEVVREYLGDLDRNIDDTGTNERDALMRIKVSEFTSKDVLPGGGAIGGNAKARIVLEAVEERIYGIVKVTGYDSATVVSADVLEKHPLESVEATDRWSEGAWSTRRGFPRACTFHEQRIFYGGTTHQPQTIWGSVIDDFENFEYGTNADEAFTYTLASTEQHTIQWLASQEKLLIGTSGSEWVAESTNTDLPISPTNFRAKKQSEYGSAYLPPVLAADTTVFSQRQGRRIREFRYAYEKDGYVAPELTLLAEQTTRGGVKQMAMQHYPDPIIWFTTQTGGLTSLTYDPTQNIFGFARHTGQTGNGFDCYFESVATLYGPTDDEVYLIAYRNVSGTWIRSIEVMDTNARAKLEAGYFYRGYYLDCATQYGPATAVSSLPTPHLPNGAAVTIVTEAGVFSGSVSGGAVALPATVPLASVGLGYKSRAIPLQLEVPMDASTSMTRSKRDWKFSMQLFNSTGAIQVGENKVGVIVSAGIFKQDADRVLHPVETPGLNAPFSGPLPVNVEGAYSTNDSVELRITIPTPFCVLAMKRDFDIYGKE